MILTVMKQEKLVKLFKINLTGFQLLKQQWRVIKDGSGNRQRKDPCWPYVTFLRLLVLIEREEEIREYSGFELTAFPTSLFQNGIMRKANKSKLTKALKKNASSNSYQAGQSFHVLDGGALFHKIKWLPNISYQSILNQYSR